MHRAAFELRHFDGTRDVRAELLRLRKGVGGQRLAGHACRESQVILDAGTGASLAAGRQSIQHDDAQAFRCGIDGGGQAGRACPDDCDVIDPGAIEFG